MMHIFSNVFSVQLAYVFRTDYTIVVFFSRKHSSTFENEAGRNGL